MSESDPYRHKRVLKKKEQCQLMKNDDGFMKYIKNIDRLNDNNQTIRPDHDPVIPKCHLKDMILKLYSNGQSIMTDSQYKEAVYVFNFYKSAVEGS